ncbi:hypothetical protein CLV48_11020 [Cecembia rubra]|uniref:Uncharacterized protein n=2 Tax=Cecembia rubra TaxID=1485585 RepID=A0A2P8DYD9_9BACT|nr:hypothetical protein CLV48_11020 [Cecembia rubra]
MFTWDKARSELTRMLYMLLFKKGLKKKQVKAISYFIWSLDYFGVVNNDGEIRIGIEQNLGEGSRELVLRINEDVLWLGIEGSYKSDFGSDGYEIAYFIGYPDGSVEETLEDSSNDERLEQFLRSLEESIDEETINLEIEYWGEYKTV